MDAKDVLIDAFSRIEGYVGRVLNGLSREDLRWQPKSDCNPIGWTVWHLTRVQDIQVSALAGIDQAWVVDGWAGKFGRDPNPGDIGFGRTPNEVAAFDPPEATVLFDYYRAVWTRTRLYLETLSDSDLDRVLNEPRWNPMPTVGVRLVSTVNDCALHSGEASYVRGLLQGFGWQVF